MARPSLEIIVGPEDPLVLRGPELRLRLSHNDDPESDFDCEVHVQDGWLEVTYAADPAADDLKRFYQELLDLHAGKISEARLFPPESEFRMTFCQSERFFDRCAVFVALKRLQFGSGSNFESTGFGFPRTDLVGIARRLRELLVAHNRVLRQ